MHVVPYPAISVALLVATPYFVRACQDTAAAIIALPAMHTIEAKSGLICLWDPTLGSLPKFSDLPALRSELRRKAEKAECFFIHTDDPVTYRLKILRAETLPAEADDEFERNGGVFRIRVASGRLRCASVPDELSTFEIDVDVGNYLVIPFSRRAFDSSRYKSRMIRLVGDADRRFHQRVSNVGGFGCLFMMLAVVLLAVPSTRKFWGACLLLLFIPTAVYHLMLRLPRCRRVEMASAEYERSLPHHYLLLTPSSDTNVPGGWISPAGNQD